MCRYFLPPRAQREAAPPASEDASPNCNQQSVKSHFDSLALKTVSGEAQMGQFIVERKSDQRSARLRVRTRNYPGASHNLIPKLQTNSPSVSLRSKTHQGMDH